MKYNLRFTLSFLKEAKRLGKKYRSLPDDIENLRKAIVSNPTLGKDLGNGLRKIRMQITSKGKGKSGGAQVITLTVIATKNETDVNMLFIYDKAERANVTKSEIERLLKDNNLI